MDSFLEQCAYWNIETNKQVIDVVQIYEVTKIKERNMTTKSFKWGFHLIIGKYLKIPLILYYVKNAFVPLKILLSSIAMICDFGSI